MQKFHHNIGFSEKRHFFARKLANIAENCDHNIDPGTTESLKLSLRSWHPSEVLVVSVSGVWSTSG
jgi:hypothetical protein